LIKHGKTYPVALPDFSTKAKAQAILGFDMAAFRADKEEFLKTVAKQWDEEARKRQGFLYAY
jgi:nitrite reductase (cytochrome c-552)